jgi:inorganic pyrophosphatase
VNLTRLPHQLDPDEGTCLAVIESVKGKRGKYIYNAETKAFELKGLLPEGMSFPLDYGFIPSTLAEDGDAVDVLVLADEPAFAGAVLKVRVIGVVEAEQEKRGKSVRNDRIVAVSVLSRLHESITSIGDLGEDFLTNLQQFWVNYNDLKGRAFEVLDIGDAKRACKLIERQCVKE